MSEATVQTPDPHIYIPLEKIVWPETTDITPDQIHNMAASIMLNGQAEAIVVAPTESEDLYRGVIGRLRYEGMKYRWRAEPEGKTILARVHTFESEAQLKTWRLIENVHRRELTAMQKALEYRELYDELRKESGEEVTIKVLAQSVEALTGDKESEKTVGHYLQLTKLEPKTQEVMAAENLPLRAGLEFARVEDPKKQVKAAQEVQNRPSAYRRVEDIHWRVESLIADERKKAYLKRLKKRAEDLAKEKGVTVLVEDALSWNERDKYPTFYGTVSEDCQKCAKRGIMLSGNFQQKPMCPDKKCYENMTRKQGTKARAQEKADEKKMELERAKVYDMPLDERHWRLVVYSTFDTWKLGELLGLGRGAPAKKLWEETQKLTVEQCQKMLVRKAAGDILQGQWGKEEAKKWLVTEFKLTRELFLKDEED
jgi:hypothetical protein